MAGRLGRVFPQRSSTQVSAKGRREPGGTRHLLRGAAGMKEETAAGNPEESAEEAEEGLAGAAGQRLQNTFDFMRRQLGKGGRR